jgi:sugar phosphate isomerase/epimerase
LPVGDGVVDYTNYFKQAETAGLKYYFVEHDMPTDPIDSITRSLKTLKGIIKK